MTGFIDLYVVGDTSLNFIVLCTPELPITSSQGDAKTKVTNDRDLGALHIKP